MDVFSLPVATPCLKICVSDVVWDECLGIILKRLIFLDCLLTYCKIKRFPSGKETEPSNRTY